MELTAEALTTFFETASPHLNERQWRIVAGALAEAFGRGGQGFVVEASFTIAVSSDSAIVGAL